MAFQPLFRLGNPASTGGVRSLLAFWMGGAAAVPTAPAASTRGYHVPGFWTEEHRKIKEREEGVPESIEALSKLPAFIAPPKTWGDADEQDELDELLELMEIMDHDSI
jgi:hypothetical protein